MAAAPPQKNNLLRTVQEHKTTIVYKRNIVREVRTSLLMFVVPFSIALGGPPLIYYDLYEYNNFFSRCLLADLGSRREDW